MWFKPGTECAVGGSFLYVLYTHPSQDQIAAMQKEHRGVVDGLREDLCRLETELQTAQQQQHQQQQEQGSASTPMEAKQRSGGRQDEARLLLHGLGTASARSEPRSEGEVRRTGAGGGWVGSIIKQGSEPVSSERRGLERWRECRGEWNERPGLGLRPGR